MHEERTRHARATTGIVASTTLLLAGCLDATEPRAPIDEGPGHSSAIVPPERIVNLRAVDRTVLFAEVTLRHGDVTESVTAEPLGDSGAWTVNLRVPSGTPYSLEVTWYDTLDGDRLDLVTADRDFAATFDSGTVELDFRDYDFDGYDDDLDGMTNLAEREAGTSPEVANSSAESVGCPVLPEAQSNTSGEAELGYTNPVRFTDGFDTALPSFDIESFGASDLARDVTVNARGVTLDVTSESSDDTGINIVAVDDTSDSITARVRFLDASTAIDSGSENDARINLRGVFFSTIDGNAAAAPGTDPRMGEAEVRLSLRNFLPGGNSRVLLCANVRNANGSTSGFVAGTEDGDGDGCAGGRQYSLDFENDTEILIGVGVNRENRTVVFRLDDRTLEFPFDADVFPLIRPRHTLEVSADGANVSIVVDVLDFSTENAGALPLERFSVARLYKLYDREELRNDPDRERDVANGRLRLTGSSSDSSREVTTRLALRGDTDYLEADLTLSSETEVLEGDAQARVRLSGTQYNDVRNSRVDGNEGDHFAWVGIGTDASGNVFGEACLIRLNDSENEFCGVFRNPDSYCRPFSASFALDTPYKASLRFDRAAKQLVYTLDGEQIVHEVTTNSFLPSASSGTHSVQTRMTGQGRVVGYADNLGTTFDAVR